MMATATNPAGVWQGDLWRCVRCGGAAEADPTGPAVACGACGATYPIRDDVLVVREAADANNGVAQAFYNGPLWPKFRFWEHFTWFCNGGERKARQKVLRHLPTGDGLKLLDVAVGDGVYLPWLPPSWSVVGVDVSTAQIAACRARAARRDVRLVLGEAEDLPVRDGSFDVGLSIGAFNYFNDPEKALREMARAVRPGGTIVVSDEIPNLTDRMVFRKIGLPGVDRWIVSKMMHLGDDFTDMVERYRTLDVPAIARRVLPDATYELVWHGVGYVFHGTVPG